MQTIIIEKYDNGFTIKISGDGEKQRYVWRSLDAIPMLAWLGRHLNGRKVYVTDDPNGFKETLR